MDYLNPLRLFSVLLTLELLSPCNGTGPRAEQECPIQITPDRMVVEYKGTAPSATCTPTTMVPGNIEEEIHWEVQGGVQFNSTSWSPNTHEDWDPRPFCTAKFKGIGRCKKDLNFILYKTPDTVSIRSVDGLSAVVENRQIQLQCDVTNVAPARNLVVRWFKGNESFEPRGDTIRVTGCLPEKNAECDINETRSQVNVSSTISITLNRTHSSAEFRCEAQLDLGPEMQQPLLNLTSNPLTIAVHSKPIINTTKLPKTIPVFRGYPEELVCEADGHPTPKIQWLYSDDKVPRLSNNTLIVSEAGFYNCSASNAVGSISYEVEVILKEDYLPLIAGFVAVTVVAISIVFLFIYSIYYKNTRMRRYSLKNPKLSNGNVAHNGWDPQFPMTKLS